MIGKLTGVFGGAAGDGSIIIEVRGVGYMVRVPSAALQATQAQLASELSLFIHTAVREDAIDLYGFLTEEELAFFKQLMSVSGIGPKSALNILNTAEVAVLKRGIAKGDAASLTKVFGIGKKSAERIVVELRDKMGPSTTAGAMLSGDDGEVIEALMALGYSASEARAALKSISGKDAEAGVQKRISAALKRLGSNSAHIVNKS